MKKTAKKPAKKKSPAQRTPRSKPAVKNSAPKAAASKRMQPPGDWRADMLARLRAVIESADPDAVEERKWAKATNPAGVPTWSHDGIICTGETYKNAVKLTFARGAALHDPARLFNAGLDGNVRRAIDFHEGDAIDEPALKDLVRAAVALNRSMAGPKS